MSMQQFCLRWNNHQPNFISVFSSLLNNETLVDVTLAAEGRHLQAHKVVLSACSSYFQSLFTVNPCQHPIVILKDVKFSDLKIMVDFMYYGEVNISQDQLPSIIKTAESLKIKGLAEMHTASLTKWPSGSSEPGGGGERGESCSPGPSPNSPSFRRKRLRKSSTGSTSGSADKPEEINEITLVAMNIVKPEPLIASQENSESLRRPVNASTESQGSIDEDQISIMSNMENSSTGAPAQNDGAIHNVSQQSGGAITQTPVSQPPAHQVLQYKHTVTKRAQLLRQPRVKKESEPNHLSPDRDLGTPYIIPGSVHSTAPIINLPQSRSWEEGRTAASGTTAHATLANQSNFLTVTNPTNLLTVPSYLTKQHSHPLLPSQQQAGNSNYSGIYRQHSNPELAAGKANSPSIVVELAPALKSEQEHEPALTSIEAANSGALRIKTAELTRSSSSPQASTTEMREGAGDQRLGHCPVQRPGPALGCNHCWNTIDTRGKILRRKTKYHCPECQINLCIVPCFQEFHELQREITTPKTLPKTSSI
ncbi:protein tramtrack, beta isoform isoform X2 [Prorops nasuta]|uniref:protein tramtrack, beta isoform isoform X2 n=1 Tax=Prorops nasuta TaxID=863751 RepID=UPI0034CDC5C6